LARRQILRGVDHIESNFASVVEIAA